MIMNKVSVGVRLYDYDSWTKRNHSDAGPVWGTLTNVYICSVLMHCASLVFAKSAIDRSSYRMTHNRIAEITSMCKGTKCLPVYVYITLAEE